jgi:hypothetical protein
VTPEEKKAYKAAWAREAAKSPEFIARRRINGMRSHEKNKEKHLAMSRDWKRRNAIKVKAYRSKYYQENKVREQETNAAWLAANPGFKETKLKINREYVLKNAGKIKAQRASEKVKSARRDKQNRQYATDLKFRIEKRIRASVNQGIRRVKASKCDSIQSLLGCTVDELKIHLEAQFAEGMNWDRFGEIHIDHKTPCISFDLTNKEEQRRCFHFSNLQPLWARDNLVKGKKIQSDAKKQPE